MAEQVRTLPASLVRAPTGYGLYQRVLATTPATTLVSLLSGGVLPQIPVPNISGPAGLNYVFGYVDLQSEVDPLSVTVRYTDDGQTAPTATLGFVIPGGSGWVRIPCDPNDIQLCSAGVDTQIQVRLGIVGTKV
jgi:hypothetical protein